MKACLCKKVQVLKAFLLWGKLFFFFPVATPLSDFFISERKKKILRITGFKVCEDLFSLAWCPLTYSRFVRGSEKGHQPWGTSRESGGYKPIQLTELWVTKSSTLPLGRKTSSKHFNAELQPGAAFLPFVSQGTEGNKSLCLAA